MLLFGERAFQAEGEATTEASKEDSCFLLPLYFIVT